MSSDKLLDLMKYVFPSELVDYFDIMDMQEISGTLHLYLEELNIVPQEYASKRLSPNGFYESSTLKDFPLRDKKVILHIRRRRWVDEEGTSYSRRWELAAEGTRYSKEFASFLKDAFGYLPDSSPIS